MKTVVDYLKANKKFEGTIGSSNIKINLYGDLVVLTRDTYTHTIKIPNVHNIEYAIQDILEANKIEVRFCEECGKPYDAGYTMNDGGWYSCEECFKSAMDRDYGEGKWRGTHDEGEWGGFYEHLCDDGVWRDTGVYYTEWN